MREKNYEKQYVKPHVGRLLFVCRAVVRYSVHTTTLTQFLYLISINFFSIGTDISIGKHCVRAVNRI